MNAPLSISMPAEAVNGPTDYKAGLPAGVVNILVGLGPEVGAQLVDHPLVEMVSFTGSTRVGKLTVASAARPVFFDPGTENRII